MSLNVKYEQRSALLSMTDRSDRTGRLRCIPHLHRELEMVFMLNGSAIGYADTVRTEIHAGDIFLTFPNQIHFYETIGPESFWIYIFSPDLIPEFSETLSLALPSTPLLKGVGNQPEIKRILTALMENKGHMTESDDPYLNNLNRGYLLSLFSLLLPQMDLEQVSISDSGALRAIVSFCTSNFSENLSLSLLEEKLHLNKYYISHLFSQKLGLRFNDYVNSLRISEACRYLLNSDSTITEISETVGFNTQRTFNRAFIKAMGMTPGEYRKKNFTAKKQERSLSRS